MSYNRNIGLNDSAQSWSVDCNEKNNYKKAFKSFVLKEL